MAIMRATLFFEQVGRGWTESYWRDGGSQSIADQIPLVDNLAAKRIKCSGAQTFLRYARVSAEGVFRDSANRTYAGSGLQGLTTEKSDEPVTCLLVRCRTQPFTGLKFVFLRGVWDSIVTDGGTFNPTPSFTAYFNDYAAKLTGDGWGWLGKSTSVSRLVQTVSQNANGTVGVTTAAGLFPGPFPQSTQVRISGVQGAVQVNGLLNVVATDDHTFSTTRRISIFPYTVGGKATFITKALQVIAQATPDRIANRKVGNVSYVSRGRRRVTVRT